MAKYQETETNGREPKTNRTILLRSLILLFLFGILLFIPTFAQLYKIQITEHDFYKQKAIEQQTVDREVSAKRGAITDTNGKVLAMSATVYDIILSPNDFRKTRQRWDDRYGDDPSRAKVPRPEETALAQGLEEILNIPAEVIEEKLKKETYYEVLVSQADKETSDAVRNFIAEQGLSNSIVLSPTEKRYYPYNSLAAQVIGWVNPNLENKGAYGMEALYENQLSGETGRTVQAKRGDGSELSYSFQNYNRVTDGCSVTLTLDTSVQYQCERVLEKAIEMFDVQNGGFIIAMDPKTGAIKAWANSPTYNLNEPWEITDPVLSNYVESVREDPDAAEEAYRTALADAQNKQWRNKAISDTYEPGSTFKTLVLAAALEEGVVDETSTFYCSGIVEVADQKIRCSKRTGHGEQTLAEAVANSCNPAFIKIGQKLGAKKFYQYMDDFGILEATGVDMQGESSINPVTAGLVWSQNKFTSANGITNLATASFGQGFQLTPIQLITAACSVVNGGYLMKPYVMEKITNSDGMVVASHEPTAVRSVISEATSQRCRTILEGVVDGGTGKRAYVPGYRIGGKTGSSETTESRQGKDRTIVSFLGFAPADDPQIVVLLMFDGPKSVDEERSVTAKGYYISGGNMAALMAGELMDNVLGQMGIEKHYTQAEKPLIDVTVPSLKGHSREVAEESAANSGFKVRLVGEGAEVTDQIPKGGSIIPNGSRILLYLGEEKPTDTVTVPDVRGKTVTAAQEILEQSDLYLKIGGSSRYMAASSTVVSESLRIGTEVDRGTVVECLFSDNTMTD